MSPPVNVPSRYLMRWVKLKEYCEIAGETKNAVRIRRKTRDLAGWQAMYTGARWHVMGKFRKGGPMGRKNVTEQRGYATKAAKGIAIRHWKDSTTIRISFCYKGVICRETLALPATKANLLYAERLRAEILNAIGRNTFEYGKYFPDSKRARIFGYVNENPLIGDRLREFLAHAERTLERSTVIGYQRVCNAHLFNTFGPIPIRELTPAFIRQWLSQLNLTLKAVRNILTPLRAILNDAVNDDIILRNPLDRVILNKVLNKHTRQSTFVANPFTKKEIQLLLEHSEPPFKPFVQFAFFSGLRPSELRGLRWEDIDWQKGLIHVRRAIVANQEKGTKTRSGNREVLLLPPAREALVDQKAYTFLAGQFVFHNPATQKPWRTDAQLQHHWGKPFKIANVPYRNFYQSRHTFASMLLSAGENMLWVAKQMGHRDTEMIVKTYGKFIPDMNSEVGYQPVHDWGQALGQPPASS